jgi:hypothetical protein
MMRCSLDDRGALRFVGIPQGQTLFREQPLQATLTYCEALCDRVDLVSALPQEAPDLHPHHTAEIIWQGVIKSATGIVRHLFAVDHLRKTPFQQGPW